MKLTDGNQSFERARMDQKKDWHYVGSCGNSELLFMWKSWNLAVRIKDERMHFKVK